MTKPALLFLAHRIPYPPNKGDKIRSFNLLKALARDYRVFLAAFVDDQEDWKYETELRNYCAEVLLLGLKSGQKYRTLEAFFRHEALSLPYYRNARMQDWVDRTIEEQQISRVFVFSSAMAQYVKGDSYQNLHRIIDFVDVDSEKWREYSRRRRWPMNWLYRREAACLLAFDRKISREFDASMFVSAQEAKLFAELSPESAAQTGFINNGVDSEYFTPKNSHKSPFSKDQQVLVFTGAMDYWANVDAVTWFAEQVFPKIIKQIPEAVFYIVGARPTDQVRKLSDNQRIFVTGSVKDIRPFLAHASLAVAPMRIARGIQNKVLEAMAMAKPVVATRAAMEGIPVFEELPVCDEADQFASACVRLLLSEDTSGLGKKGRELVLREFNWEQNLIKLEALLGDEHKQSDEIQTETKDNNGNTGELVL